MNYLGIDYGEKRIGVAVAETSLAEPVAVINNGPTAVAAIKQWAEKYQTGKVIVGISEQTMAQKSREFGERLRQAGLRVEFYDETLSSKEASERLKHKSRQFRAKPQDAYQAAVMLQDWLDNKLLEKDSILSLGGTFRVKNPIPAEKIRDYINYGDL